MEGGIGSDIPKHLQSFAYYDRKIKPMQKDMKTLARIRSSTEYIDEELLNDHHKEQKIKWYMRKFTELESMEQQKRAEMLRRYESQRQELLKQSSIGDAQGFTV